MTILKKFKEAYSDGDCNFVKVYMTIRNHGQQVLHQILLWGLPPGQDPNNLTTYLKDKLLAHKVKVNKTLEEKLTNDPTGKSFDVTLLHTCIRAACVNVAGFHDKLWYEDDGVTTPPSLEIFVSRIKKARNDLSHLVETLDDSQMHAKVTDIKDMLFSAIRLAGDRFGKQIEASEINDKIQEKINLMEDTKLGPDVLERNRIDMLTYSIKCDGSDELRNVIQKLICFKPLGTWGDHFVDFDRVFSNVELINVDSSNKVIDCKNILDVNSYSDVNQGLDGSVSPLLIYVEGPGGSGKTTLFKFLLSEWKKKSMSVPNLASYDLVIPITCTDSHVDSFSKLLWTLLPDTAKDFRNTGTGGFAFTDEDELLRCILDLDILVLVDGLDQMNDKSGKIFKELLCYMKSKNITMICTSLPKGKKAYCIPPELRTVHLQMNGIPEDERPQFVGKYHDEMLRLGKSSQRTQELVNYMNRTSSRIQKHFSLPLNLVLITYIWKRKPKNVEAISTATELYMEVDELRSEIFDSKFMDSSSFITENRERFEKAMFAEALICVSQDGESNIPECSKKRLVKMCQMLGLPTTQTLSHYFVTKSDSSGACEPEIVSFPHNDMQEYYAARCIYHALTDNQYFEYIKQCRKSSTSSKADLLRHLKNKIETVWRKSTHLNLCPGLEMKTPVFKRDLCAIIEGIQNSKIKKVNLETYLNVLVHFAGLLGMNGNSIPAEISNQLVKYLNTAGLVMRDQWMDFVREFKCDMMTCKQIAKFVSHDLEDEIFINDEDVGVYASFMPHAKPTDVNVELTTDPQVLPRLKDMLNAVHRHGKDRDVAVHLSLFHDAHDVHLSDDFITIFAAKNRCCCKSFLGRVSNISVLPDSLEYLTIAFAPDDEPFAQIASISSHMPKLQELGIILHMAEDINIALDPLPELASAPALHLRNAGTATITGAVTLITRLQNSQGYRLVSLLGYCESGEDVRQLVDELVAAGVKMESLQLVSSQLQTSQPEYDYANRNLGCDVTMLSNATNMTY